MAGDWIKVTHATPDKPEIVRIADRCGLDIDAAFGKCVRLWIWADQQTVDGNALTVTDAFIDRLVHCPGFSAALREVDWLQARSGSLAIPRFDRHNGQSAKQRALTRDRVKRKRNGDVVTKSTSNSSLLSDFEEFWKEVPNKISKGAAREAYCKARDKATHAAILAGLPGYAAYESTRQKASKGDYRPLHPATWLNQERWNDEPQQPGKPTKSGLSALSDAERASLYAYAAEREPDIRGYPASADLSRHAMLRHLAAWKRHQESTP